MKETRRSRENSSVDAFQGEPAYDAIRTRLRDVIIRNPEHLAIAIKYDPDKNQAPVVLAKGQDELALKIIEVGEEHQITAVENRPLARAMYPLCKVGQEIPGDFYGAVAENSWFTFTGKKTDKIS